MQQALLAIPLTNGSALGPHDHVVEGWADIWKFFSDDTSLLSVPTLLVGGTIILLYALFNAIVVLIIMKSVTYAQRRKSKVSTTTAGNSGETLPNKNDVENSGTKNNEENSSTQKVIVPHICMV